MANLLDDRALDALFRTARTRNGWENRPVSREQLEAIYDLAKMGPTSANLSPARFVFVESAEGKGTKFVVEFPAHRDVHTEDLIPLKREAKG